MNSKKSFALFFIPMKPDVLQDVNNTVRIAEVTVVWTERKDIHFGLIWALISAQSWNSTLLQGHCVTLASSLRIWFPRLYNCDTSTHLARILYTWAICHILGTQYVSSLSFTTGFSKVIHFFPLKIVFALFFLMRGFAMLNIPTWKLLKVRHDLKYQWPIPLTNLLPA